MIDYEKWLRENTVEYRGYQIVNGSVDKNGECLSLVHCRIPSTDEQKAELLADAKAWVDKQIDGKAA